MITVRHRSATSLGLAATLAPSRARDLAFSWVRLWTKSSYPARCRLRAIGKPMMPSPDESDRVSHRAHM